MMMQIKTRKGKSSTATFLKITPIRGAIMALPRYPNPIWYPITV
jgi:hypothetical protein